MPLTKLRRVPARGCESFFVLILGLVKYTRSKTDCDLQFCWTKFPHYFILFKNDTKNLNFSAQGAWRYPASPRR